MNKSCGIVFVVDDDASVRKAVVRLFQPTEYQVKAFESAQEFLDYPRPDLPGCLVLDLRMPGLSGIELQQKLIADDPNLPIVFLTGHGDVPSAVNVIKAGAVDFLPKPVDKQRLRQVVADSIARSVSTRHRSRELSDFRKRVRSLTPRENEVMTLVISGLLNKQIARRLGITEGTVKLHRGHVMEKTGAATIADLVRLCERAGISKS